MNTIRSEEYDVKVGRVVVEEQERNHSNTTEVRAREFDDNDTRMNFYRFAVNGPDTVNLVSGSTDRPTSNVIASIHKFGYEISNVDGTRLREVTDVQLPPHAFFVTLKRTFDGLQDDYSDSKALSIYLEGMSYLCKQGTVFLSIYDDRGPDWMDTQMSDLFYPGADIRRKIEGIFSQAVNPTESRSDVKADEIFGSTAEWADDYLDEQLVRIMDEDFSDMPGMLGSSERWHTVDEIRNRFPSYEISEALDGLEDVNMVELARAPDGSIVAARHTEFARDLYEADDDSVDDVYEKHDIEIPEVDDE